MMDKTASSAILAASGLLAATLLCVANAQSNAGLRAGAGRAVTQKMCVGCHSANVATSKRATPEQWSAIVQQMVARGAEGTDEQIETVIQYLSENYGPQSPKSEPVTGQIPQTSTKNSNPAQETPPAAQSQLQSQNASDIDSDHSSIRVNVNSAGARELQSALLLTQKEAQTLVRYREQNGVFKDWQEVAEVPGVPAGKIQDLRKRIIF